jgi:hypothetical protein
MKIKVTMKDPDTLDDAISDAVSATDVALMDGDEQEAVAEIRMQKARALASKWFEYGEYLTVEIDTDAGTCVVVPVHE